ncbi:hypothetical protein C8J56DRAFT_933315, partial [Mycena floridula]
MLRSRYSSGSLFFSSCSRNNIRKPTMQTFIHQNISDKDLPEARQISAFTLQRYTNVLQEHQAVKLSVVCPPSGHGSHPDPDEVEKGPWWTVRAYDADNWHVFAFHIRPGLDAVTGLRREDTQYPQAAATRLLWVVIPLKERGAGKWFHDHHHKRA